MPDIDIRQAEVADWTAVANLLQACALPVDGAREHFGTYMLAVVDGAVVGSAGLEIYPPFALLRSVAVAPSHQGRGIGQALIAAVEVEAHRSGISTMYRLTTTAKAYFPRFGFSVEARELAPTALQTSAEFRGACPASAALMLRRIAG